MKVISFILGTICFFQIFSIGHGIGCPWQCVRFPCCPEDFLGICGKELLEACKKMATRDGIIRYYEWQSCINEVCHRRNA
ncbi:UNVERIFIED_CONTAM: hypothetical protein RMT77_019630 [Armadillidium vulgare]